MEVVNKLSLLELIKELKMFNAKLSGRKCELVERLQFYIRNKKPEEVDPRPFEPKKMLCPAKTQYHEIGEHHRMPKLLTINCEEFLSQQDEKIRKKSILLYENEYLP